MRKVIEIIFLGVFFVSIGVSIFRTVVNISKIFTEEKAWIFLSQEQKKQKLYGDLYYFYKDIQNASRKDVVLLSKDGKAYYLGRYLLYPQKIYWADNETILQKLIQDSRGSMVAIYHPQDFPKFVARWDQYSTIKHNNTIIGVVSIKK